MTAPRGYMSIGTLLAPVVIVLSLAAEGARAPECHKAVRHQLLYVAPRASVYATVA